MASLRLRPEDCSILGQLILKHMEQQQISMNKLAKQVGITQPGLRSACLKGSTPTESTLLKLSHVMGVNVVHLYALIYEEKMQAATGANTETPTAFRQLFTDVFDVLNRWVGQFPEEQRPSQSALADSTLKAITSLKASIACRN